MSLVGIHILPLPFQYDGHDSAACCNKVWLLQRQVTQDFQTARLFESSGFTAHVRDAWMRAIWANRASAVQHLARALCGRYDDIFPKDMDLSEPTKQFGRNASRQLHWSGR
jgi:hypothetical protein